MVILLVLLSRSPVFAEFGRFLAVVNGAAKDVSSSLVDLTTSAINATTEMVGVVSIGAGFVQTAWEGVDLQNTTVDRRYGRVLALDHHALTEWVQNFSVPGDHWRVQQTLMSVVWSVDNSRPVVEAEDAHLDLAGGKFWKWRARARTSRRGTAMAVEVFAVQFVPAWAFPAWQTLEIPLSAANRQISVALHQTLRDLEPVVREVEAANALLESLTVPRGPSWGSLACQAVCAGAGGALAAVLVLRARLPQAHAHPAQALPQPAPAVAGGVSDDSWTSSPWLTRWTSVGERTAATEPLNAVAAGQHKDGEGEF